MKKLLTRMMMAALCALGFSAFAADSNQKIELMAGNTAPVITTDTQALKWTFETNGVAATRLEIGLKRSLLDATAELTITANGTEASAEDAVITLVADDTRVKTVTVKITAKVDKDYLAENATVSANNDWCVVNNKDAIVVKPGATWTYTTVTKGNSWTLTRADGTYKSYSLNGNFGKYMQINGAAPSAATMNLTANADGTVTFSVTGVDSAGAKALILSLRNDDREIMKIQIIIGAIVEDISMKIGETVRRAASYGETATGRHWVFNNNGSAENVVSLAVKNGETAMDTTGVTLSNHPDFKWQTTGWQASVNADLTANKPGKQVVSIARINNTDQTSFATMYEYNVFVHEEKEDSIDCAVDGMIKDKVFESAEVGAWQASSSDESVVTVSEAGMPSKEFTPTITAKGEGTATLTVENYFTVYTVTVRVGRSVGGKVYEMTQDGNCTIFGEGVATSLPSGFDLNSITNVEVEAGITEIGEAFFYKCRKLKTVTLGKDVVTVGTNAFYLCVKLEKITAGNAAAVESLAGAVVIRAAFDSEGYPCVVPQIDAPGYENVLLATDNLAEPKWEPIDPQEAFADGAPARFFKFVIQPITVR